MCREFCRLSGGTLGAIPFARLGTYKLLKNDRRSYFAISILAMKQLRHKEITDHLNIYSYNLHVVSTH